MAEISVQPLFHGNIYADRDLLVTGHPEYLLTRSNHEKNKVWCDVPSFTYLIEHPDGRMLFDASIHRNWENEWLPEYKELCPYDDHTEEQLFENTLKNMNLGPEDIDYVFLSHLHCDHAGNARLFAGADTEIFVHEDEYTMAANRQADGDFFLRVDYDIPGARFTTLPGDSEVLKGIHAISLPGHTAGLMGLMIHLQHSGTIILASDAFYKKENYDFEVGSMVTPDPETWKRSLHKLKMIARAHNATVVGGHDHSVCHEGEGSLAREEKLRLDRAYG